MVNVYLVANTVNTIKRIVINILGQTSNCPLSETCNRRADNELYTMIQIIMQVMFFKIFRKILLQNKTFTAIAFYYDQPLMLI